MYVQSARAARLKVIRAKFGGPAQPLMSRFAQPSQDDSGYVLVARMDNAKNLSSILKAVHFREVRILNYKC